MVASFNKALPIDGNIIMFLDQDMGRVCTLHDNALVVTLQMPHAKVNRILVERGVGVNILFKDTVERMRLLSDVTKT